MSNDPKQPKKLELTEPAPRKPEEGGEGVSLPVSIELNQKRRQHNQNFENLYGRKFTDKIGIKR